MSTHGATLPSLSELEAALVALNRNCKDESLLAVLGISKVQDMLQQTLHIGDIEHYGAMLLKMRNKPRAPHGGADSLLAAAFKKLDSALEMMAMGVSMSADGKLAKAERSFSSYLNLPGASYIGMECNNFSQKASWGDYLDLVKYMTQDSGNIHNIHLQHCSEDTRKGRLNDIACSFSLFVGKDIGEHLSNLMGRTGSQSLPAPVVDLLREQEDKFATLVMEKQMSSSDSLKMVDHYRTFGLEKLAKATIEAAKSSLFMNPDHFVRMAEYGVVFDQAWHAEQFEKTKDGSGNTATPQLFYHLCTGGDSYCPPLEKMDWNKRAGIVASCCNMAYPLSTENFDRVRAYLEDYVKDSDMAQELLSAGLNTDIAKHVKIMLPHAFSKDLGL
jgi:hypothetical protein